MKTKKAAQSSVDIGNLSIPDAEEIIEQALNELAFSPDPGLARACSSWRLRATRLSWSYAAKTAAASAATLRRIRGRQRTMSAHLL